jgi:molecular chaperone GrpE
MMAGTQIIFLFSMSLNMTMLDLVWIVLSLFLAIAVALAINFYRRGLRALERMRTSHGDELHRIGAEHDARIARLGREAEDRLRYSHHRLVEDLLPALDALHEAAEQARSAQQQQWCDGLDLTIRQFDAALSRHGIEVIAPSPGLSFDPRHHEAVQVRVDSDLPEGSVVETLRRGYRQGERVLRPAMVVIHRALEPAGDRPVEDRPEGPPEEQ